MNLGLEMALIIGPTGEHHFLKFWNLQVKDFINIKFKNYKTSQRQVTVLTGF